jgi:hypothetical protein
VIRTLGQANRIFLFDAGQSGLSLRNPGFLSRNRGMLGMRLRARGPPRPFRERLYHPSFGKGDTLIVASASGRTESVLHI